MKTLITLMFVFFANQSHAQWGIPDVVETISDQTRSVELKVAESTFIPNIQGYACALPAINIPFYQIWDAKLRHNQTYAFGVNGYGLRIQDPNMQFCVGWPSPEQVFGVPMNEGDIINLEVRVVREIVEYKVNGENTTYLRETITSELGGHTLFSDALVAL